MLWLLLACTGPDPGVESPVDPPSADDSPVEDSELVTEPVPDLPWSDSPCDGVSVEGSGYAETVATFGERGFSAPGQLVVAGSSSVRRWERGFSDLARWGVVQRGFGGAHLTDIAGFAPELILAHAPAGALVFAGTNDVAAGHEPSAVVERYRCLAQQLHDARPGAPLLFIGITPTPARWEGWSRAEEVNQAVAGWAAQHPSLVYVDIPSAFLETGSPPDASLFVSDGLHLSESGYALWTATLLPELQAALSERTPETNPSHPESGARLRVDLGPSNPEDGNPVSNPDPFGATWNSWHGVDGGVQILPGQGSSELLTTEGSASGIRLVIGGGFLSNGLLNGGLVAPSPELLGELAVAEATQDYFYVDGPDNPGALSLVGLDPARRYGLRLFASRDWGDERRVSRYTVSGADSSSQSLLTSGPDIGHEGYDGNDDRVLAWTGLAPDAWGQLHIDVAIEEGSYGYLALLELEIE